MPTKAPLGGLRKHSLTLNTKLDEKRLSATSFSEYIEDSVARRTGDVPAKL